MIDACTFTNVPVAAGSGLKGGAISIGAANTTPTITITNCSFDDVVSGAEDHGGAIYVADRDTTVTITDCFFTNVFSGGGGGAIYLANDRTNIMENLTFVNVGTISVLANSGGAINCDSADPLSEHVVRNCTFTDMDFAGSAEGGAVRLDDGKATIDACTFRNVTCAHTGTKGGALSIGGAATTPGVTITNCTFTGITGGSADDGGAVWIADRDAPVVVTDSAFTNIIGGASGGAIACGGDVNNTFRNLTFRDIHTVSTGASHGGAIALDSAEITAQHTILNCTFADVTLAGSDGGGGVYIDDGAAWIENCTFRDVKVAHSKGGGGAIRIKSGEAAAVMITNAMFSSVCGGSSNDAVARGGAIYVGARTEPVTIVNCQFSDVTTGPSGGAICSLAMNESLIRDCTFQSVSNTAGGANNGGAISLAGTLTNGTHTVRNCTFTDVHQSGSGGGGAIWNDDGNLVVDNCLFQNVRTTEPKGGGGAIECSAGNVPGSVWIGNSKFFNITAGTANSAAAHGGAIQIQERIDPVTIVGCVFSNTSSGVHGGAVYLGLATPAQVRTIDRCTFIKCTNSVATYDGGAVYFGNAGAGSRIVNSVFANNRSADDGGAVYLAAAGSTLDLIHCTFYTNSATDQGGGIYVTASTFLSVTNCIFRDNLGGPGDKDIFAISTATVEIDYSNIDQSESTGLDIIGANMFDTDPLFENPAGYDLRLKRESPLANEGLELDDVLVDRDGSPRPQGASSDIGAFEIPANLDAMIFRLL
jgi:predicted outer membrane repeat protein